MTGFDRIGRKRPRCDIRQPPGVRNRSLAAAARPMHEQADSVGGTERLDLDVSRSLRGLRRCGHRYRGTDTRIARAFRKGPAGRGEQQPHISLAVLDPGASVDHGSVPGERRSVDLAPNLVRAANPCGFRSIARRGDPYDQVDPHVRIGLPLASPDERPPCSPLGGVTGVCSACRHEPAQFGIRRDVGNLDGNLLPSQRCRRRNARGRIRGQIAGRQVNRRRQTPAVAIGGGQDRLKVRGRCKGIEPRCQRTASISDGGCRSDRALRGGCPSGHYDACHPRRNLARRVVNDGARVLRGPRRGRYSHRTARPGRPVTQ
jgi:hypothetical protein